MLTFHKKMLHFESFFEVQVRIHKISHREKVKFVVEFIKEISEISSVEILNVKIVLEKSFDMLLKYF